jgi:hypothetical protein
MHAVLAVGPYVTGVVLVPVVVVAGGGPTRSSRPASTETSDYERT